MRKRLYKS